jgi:hypothetical protein
MTFNLGAILTHSIPLNFSQGIAGQAGKKKSQNKLDAEKLGLLEQNKEVADMLDELSSDRQVIGNAAFEHIGCILISLVTRYES